MSSKRRLLLCANPAASGFTGGLHRAVLARLRTEFEVDSEWPKTPADTRRLSAEAAADGYGVVAAMGGDGVVHHVANGVAGTDTALGIVPAGTTNVLARLVGVPARATKAAEVICEITEARPIPSAVVELFESHVLLERRRATFSVGVGFDAEVVEVAEQEPFRKYRFGGLHYARSAASVVWGGFGDRSPTLGVSDGTRQAEAVAVLVQLHPTYTYFGKVPMRFGVHQPGCASVLVAHRLRRTAVAALFAAAVAGRDASRVEGVEIWNGVTDLTITDDSAAMPAQADGELLGSPTSMRVGVQGDALQIIAPRSGARRSLLRRG